MSLGAVRFCRPLVREPIVLDEPENYDGWNLDTGDDFCPACDGLAWACLDPNSCAAEVRQIRERAGLSCP